MKRLIVIAVLCIVYVLSAESGIPPEYNAGLIPDVFTEPLGLVQEDYGYYADNIVVTPGNQDTNANAQRYSNQVSDAKLPSLMVSTNFSDTVFDLVSISSGESFPIKKGRFSGAPGEYKLTASKWGYYSQQIRFTIRENVTYPANFKLVPLPVSMMTNQSKLRYQSYMAVTTLAVGIGATVFLYNKADQSYDSYLAATEPPSASTWRSSYVQWRDLYNLTLCLDLIPATWYTITAIKGLVAKNRIKTEMKYGVPFEGEK